VGCGVGPAPLTAIVKLRNTFVMGIKTRRRLGIALLLISVVAAVILQLLTGKLVAYGPGPVTTSDWGPVHTTFTMEFVTFKAVYVIPLVVVGLAGLMCLLLPPRRPPRVRQ
jgi:hypothetical protein